MYGYIIFFGKTKALLGKQILKIEEFYVLKWRHVSHVPKVTKPE